MIPDREGIWEWFEKDGTRRLMTVVDVELSTREQPWLRVYWWGGYYNVADNPNNPGLFGKREWPDNWGKRVGGVGSMPEEALYNGPTPEQREKILDTLRKHRNERHP